jgi:CDP-diacylglycerol--serine O-phosphatidyltransferase
MSDLPDDFPSDQAGQTDDPAAKRGVARMSLAVVPTLFTLGNMLCGFAAIFVASSSIEREQLPFQWTALTFAAFFIFLGMLLDGLDGHMARMTRSFSDLGEQLDSLADMVTFGVAPAIMAVHLVNVGMPFVSEATDGPFNRAALVIAGIYVVCAALRLARFNVEKNQEPEDHNYFSGLPSPGAAGTVAALVLLHQHFLSRSIQHWSVTLAAGAMVAVMLLVAIAMVSQFRYVHVMNRYVRGRAPFGTMVKAVIIGLLLVVWPQGFMALGLVAYALSAPATAVYRWIMGTSA